MKYQGFSRAKEVCLRCWGTGTEIKRAGPSGRYEYAVPCDHKVQPSLPLTERDRTEMSLSLKEK